MSVNKYCICLLFLTILLLELTFCQDATEEALVERPFFRILAPKFICNDKKSNQSEPPASKRLTISLQTREGQKLRYDIKIDFVMLDGFQNQRHTLSIWKNIRMMQSRFANISDEISLKNQIDIDATELTPQVIYTFTVVGYDDKNQASDAENFTITYKGGEIKTVRPDLGDGVSLLLFGSEFLYDDAEFLAVAEVTFCEPIDSYYFRWNISGLSSDIYTNYFDVKSNYLQLPAGTLTSGKSNDLSVVLFNNESLTLGSSKLEFKIISRDFQVVISPSDCIIGISRPIKFYAQLFRFSGSTQDVEVTWICSQHGESDCSSNFGNSSTVLDPSITFISEGDYELQVQITINNITKTATSKMRVNGQVIPHVEVKSSPKQPVSVINQHDFHFTIMDLIPKCVATWYAKEEENFATYEGSNATFASIIVRDVEEQFLNELVDYDNNTLSKDITLTIPKNTLKPNEKYKFSLTISCPEPLPDGTQTTNRQNVTSFYDIVLDTNGAPEAQPLEIYPMSGVPMKTSFKFSTGAAKDASTDFPLKYKFGYIVKSLKIIVGEYYENMVTNTELPYSDAVETFFEVCDNNDACASVKGPNVAVNASYTYSKDEIDFKVDKFQSKLKRSEYSGALNDGVVLLVTMKKVLGDSSAIESSILTIMKSELNILKSSSESGYLYEQRVISFVSMSKGLLSIMTDPDDSLVEEVLTLSDTVNNSQAKRPIKRDTLNRFKKSSRIMTPDFKNNVLSLSEILLNSKNTTTVQREQGKYVDKIHQYIASMCELGNYGFFRNDSKFASFEIVKMFSRQLSSQPLSMPGRTAISVQVSTSSSFPAKFVCIGKVRFNMDFFDTKFGHKMTIYETGFFEDSGNGKFQLTQTKSLGDWFLIKIPMASGDTSKCSVWNGNQWSPDNCEKQTTNNTNLITFKCKTNDFPITIKCDGLAFIVEQIATTTVLPRTTVTTTSSVEQTLNKNEVTQSIITTIQTDTVTGTTTILPSTSMALETTTVLTTSILVTSVQTTMASTMKTDLTPMTTTQNSSSPLNPLSTVAPVSPQSPVSQTSSVSQTSPVSQTSSVTTLSPVSTAVSIQTSPTTISATIQATSLNSVSTSPAVQAPTSSSMNNQSTSVNSVSQSTTMLSPQMSTLAGTVSSLENVTINALNNETEKLTSNGTDSEVSAKIAENSQDASISWTLIILLLFFFVTILILFLYHKYRSHAETADVFPMRNPANFIRYAKFHDEFIMQ